MLYVAVQTYFEQVLMVIWKRYAADWRKWQPGRETQGDY